LRAASKFRKPMIYVDHRIVGLIKDSKEFFVYGRQLVMGRNGFDRPVKLMYYRKIFKSANTDAAADRGAMSGLYSIIV
jgi:hypothetical protein